MAAVDHGPIGPARSPATGAVMTHRFWRLSPLERTVAIVAVLLTMVSKGFVAFVRDTHTPDDILWLPLDFGFDLLIPFFAAQGRFLQPVIAELFLWLGFNIPRASPAGVLIMAASHAVAVVLICRMWRLEATRDAAIVVAVILSLHPYLVEYYIWHAAVPFFGLALVASLLGLALLEGGARHAILGVLALIAGLCLYQAGILFAIAVAVGAIVMERATWLGHAVAPRPLRWHARRLAIVVAATGIYAALVLVVHRHYSISDPLSRVDVAHLRPDAIFARAANLAHDLWLNDVLTTPLARHALVVVVLWVIGGFCALRLLRRRRGAAMGAVCLLAMFPAAVAFSILLPSFSYREISALSVAWAAAFAAVIVISGPGLRAVFRVVVAVVAVWMLSHSVEAIADVQRVIRRETALLARVVQRIEELDVERRVEHLVAVGTNPAPIADLRTVIAPDRVRAWMATGNLVGVGVSIVALDINHVYVAALINEFSGRTFSVSGARERYAAALDYCGGVAPWPASSSIGIRDDLAILCLESQEPPWQILLGRR